MIGVIIYIGQVEAMVGQTGVVVWLGWWGYYRAGTRRSASNRPTHFVR